VSLKQDIVIVNEFSTPFVESGKQKGSRGGTPGQYVLRYMARKGATEPLTPIRKQRQDLFIERYMARFEATESLEIGTVSELKKEMYQAQGKGGLAFGYGQVSLSDDSLKAASKNVQELFESGHTVMKTVLSFDEEYLRKHKIIPEDFIAKEKGDYRGNLDQMKLRLAIMNGVDRMGRTFYDDLRYVGVIQVDTLHVHCHLAMVDAGPGRRDTTDGTQRGKINDQAKNALRRGVDSWLDEKQSVKYLSSAVGYERRNVTTFVKKWAHEQMLKESLPQFLLACLPKDRRLWRYSTNAKVMQKPKRIAEEIVESVLALPDSPYEDALTKVKNYANYRKKNEALSKQDWQKIVDRGQKEIIERGVNAIFGLLRGLPDDVLRIKTPMLEIMGLDYEEITKKAIANQKKKKKNSDAPENDLVSFGFRLRSYSSRLQYHANQRKYYHNQAKNWEIAYSSNRASVSSHAMYRHFRIEEEYHARVQAKYRHLLNFLPASTVWEPWVAEVSDYGEKLLSLQSLRKDDSLRKTKDPAEAEQIGLDIYGQRGGALMSLGDKESLAELDQRITKMKETHTKKIADVKIKLADAGLILTEKVIAVHDKSPLGVAVANEEKKSLYSDRTFEVLVGDEFDFERTKALDLHHMSFDFSQDVPVGYHGREGFVRWAVYRKYALDEAVDYLQSSNQESLVDSLPQTDVNRMVTLAERYLQGLEVLPSQTLAEAGRIPPRSKTTPLDKKLQDEIEMVVMGETKKLASAITDENVPMVFAE